MIATTKELLAYVAHCPTCGKKLTFDPPFRSGDTEAVQAFCRWKECGNIWSIVFDLDKSGTFGVMSFQCDNEDRITE